MKANFGKMQANAIHLIFQGGKGTLQGEWNASLFIYTSEMELLGGFNFIAKFF